MAKVSTAEPMALEDSNKRSTLRSRQIFRIELPLMLFFIDMLIFGVIRSGSTMNWLFYVLLNGYYASEEQRTLCHHSA